MSRFAALAFMVICIVGTRNVLCRNLLAEDVAALINLDETSFANTTVCGGALTTRTGSISYKQYDDIKRNERCAWIIRPDQTELADVTGITLGILHMGFQSNPDEHQILVSAFSVDNPRGTHITPSDIGLINVNANVVVITFSTGSEMNPLDKTGIYIQFEAHTDGSAQIASPRSTINYIDQDITFLQYPPRPADTYADNEISLFLFAQSDRTQDPTEQVGVTVVVDELETNCRDPLDIFYFDGSAWVFEKQFCDGASPEMVENRDLILGVFHTDGSNVFSGFFLTSAKCGSSGEKSHFFSV